MRIWKPGELCTVQYEGKTRPAIVLLASDNGRSLVLEFDGEIGGYVRHMSVLAGGDGGTFQDLIHMHPVEIHASDEAN